MEREELKQYLKPKYSERDLEVMGLRDMFSRLSVSGFLLGGVTLYYLLGPAGAILGGVGGGIIAHLVDRRRASYLEALTTENDHNSSPT